MEESVLIQKARAQLEAIKGKTLTLVERKDQAIALAALLLEEARRIQTPAEKRQQAELAGMMHDPIGKIFTTLVTDQCFRSRRSQRIADQLTYVINTLGIPSYLSRTRRFALRTFAAMSKVLAPLMVPATVYMIHQDTRHVILPGEKKALAAHIHQRRQEGIRVNLNHLGEAILGEAEAQRRLQIYLDDLAKPEVECISVKISTIYSQINLLAWEDTLHILAERLRQLYRAAIQHPYKKADGTQAAKFVNLDMEEYRDLNLTVALFRKVLDEPEFYAYQAGLVLQSYLPDAFLIQQELTIWAMQRLAQGGAPIKLRLVKGANLAMEQVEASLRLWPQAPYLTKVETDANFKRMVSYGCQKAHAHAAHIGVGSHNLFDIAYALLLRAENGVEQEVGFEMLEGMADHMRRVVQKLSGDMLLYCPAATRDEFQNAVAYLMRRLDENTAPDNFLRHAFDLKPNTPQWDQQVQLFTDTCLLHQQASYFPRRTQNRMKTPFICYKSHFSNEPDTDWSLPQNRRWAEHILQEWKKKVHDPLPLVINGQSIPPQGKIGIGEDPSYPSHPLYHYALATETQVDLALETAKKAESVWSHTSVEERMQLLSKIAQELRFHRQDLIGAMIADTAKTMMEADSEVSEAIDFAEYYRFNLQEWHHLPDIQWKAKGTILVAPPWNFPCSIPAGGILAALATGNCVIFKPAPEAILVGWQLAQLFWKAGISQQILQFITCEDDPVGNYLIQDPRLAGVVLTGATATAKHFLRLRPDLDLMAETGGKNTMVITALADRDLAIKDLLQSAFGHAGQKCSACSLAILEAEVYDDPHFRQQLHDAAASLAVGTPWNLKTKVNPLIHRPNPNLLKGLTELKAGESWLLQPKQNPNNPHLWSPGIKLGVKPSHFTFQHELFGPVLGLVRAENVEHAFSLMNQTAYGLTAGLHSLDEREQKAWLKRIEAGNCYINRTMTGAIVERQPFGGCKESSFGKGAKAGGPNYLIQLMQAEQIHLPTEQSSLNPKVQTLSLAVEHHPAFVSDLDTWKASVGNYAFYWDEYFSHWHDPSLVLGQDNFQCYVPHTLLVIRGQKGDSTLDLLRLIAAALTCGTRLEISVEEPLIAEQLQSLGVSAFYPVQQENHADLAQRIEKDKINRIRMLQKPPHDVRQALAQTACCLHVAPVMANGRLELLHFLREVSISHDYHRYGNLGAREREVRHPSKENTEKISTCEDCHCHEST